MGGGGGVVVVNDGANGDGEQKGLSCSAICALRIAS